MDLLYLTALSLSITAAGCMLTSAGLLFWITRDLDRRCGWLDLGGGLAWTARILGFASLVLWAVWAS